MAKNVTVTPADGDIQFENTSGTAAGRIEQNGDDLVISNAVGDVLFGDTNSDVYIGDGVNSVDLLFEQSGSIKAEDGSSGVTLTVGSSDTTLSLYAPQLTTTMTIGSGGSIDFTPDTGTVLSFDNQSIIRRLNANGGVSIGHDDQVIIAGGDTSSVMDSNITGEVVAIGAEGGLRVYGFPNNNTSWSNRVQFSFNNDGKMYFGTASDTNIYRSAANTLKTDDSFVVGDKLYITTLDANTSSTTALVMNGTEVEKRTLGSLAFDSTTLGTAASSAATDFVAVGGDQMTGTLEIKNTAPIIKLNDSNATNTTNLVGYISLQVNGTENGWVGYGSSGNSDLTLKNNNGKVVLNGSTGAYVGSNEIWDAGDFTSTDVSNWNTAYGWGDHGEEGYLTSYTETDTLATVTNRGATTSIDSTFSSILTASGTLDATGTIKDYNYQHAGNSDWRTKKYVRSVGGSGGDIGDKWVHLTTVDIDGAYEKVTIKFTINGYDDVSSGVEAIDVRYENGSTAQESHTLNWYSTDDLANLFSEVRSIRTSSSGLVNRYNLYVKMAGDWRDTFTIVAEYWATHGSSNPITFETADGTATEPSSGSNDIAKTSRVWYTENTDMYFGGNKVWHAGNDGASSGLDADTLDGNQSSAFLLKSGGTMTGNIILGANKIAADTTAPTAHIQVGAGTTNTGNRSDVALLGASNSGGVVNALGLVNTAAGANSNGVALNFHNGNAWSPTGQIIVKQNSSGTSTDSGMYFYTYDGGLNNRMTIKNDGNIRLHAYGAGLLQTDANGNVSVDTSSYLTSIGSNSVGITELNVADGSNGQVLTTDGNGTLSFTTVTSGSSYTLPAATDDALGGIKLGYTEANKNYAVQLDSNSKAFVAVGWTDTQYSNATTSVSGLMSSTDKTKLDGIATGAEVNVQSDWNATTGDAFIQNKPTLFDGAYSSLTGVPSTFAPSSHNHDSRYYTESEMQHFMARALGWVSAYGNSAEGYVNYDFTNDAVEISGGGDNTTGGAFKAIRVKSGDKVRFTVMLKGSDSSTSGLYLRLYQHDGTLPDGKTHVSNNASSSEGVVQEDDRADTSWEENRPVPSTWTTYEHTYTAGADGYVSLVVLNWSGHEEKSIYVKQPDIQFEKVNDASKLGGTAASSYLTAHPSITEATTNLSNSGRTYIQSITLDSNGHVTGVSTGTETVTNTNTTYSAGSGLDLTSTTFSIEADLRDGITHVGKDTSNYITFDSTNSRIDFYAGGTFVARMESDGDLHIKGDVIAFSNIFS